LGNLNKYTGTTADYLSYALAAFGYDPSGHFLKFT
jgi:hypothetical protein